MATLRAMILMAAAPLLASCASSGLYDMSDEWCAKHLDASEAHCPKDHERVAANEVAHNDSGLRQ